jgi:hypothetical protein
MNKLKWMALSLGVTGGALFTWIRSYSQLEVEGIDYRVIVAISTLILSFFYRFWTLAGTFTTGFYLSLGILLALLLRIGADIYLKSIEHDLWPLEIAIFSVIAFPAAFIGAYLAELLQYSKRRS